MKNILPILGLTIISIFPNVVSLAQNNAPSTFSGNSKHNTLPNKADANWLSGAEQYLTESEYYFKQIPGDIFVTANRKQKTGFSINKNKLTAEPIQFSSPTKTSSWSTS